MKRLCVLVSIAACCFSSAFAQESKDPYQVGEKWIYKHDGPRQESWQPEQLVGDRIRTVVTTQGEGDAKRWVIREAYGENDERAFRCLISADKLISRLEFGEDRGLDYDPPVAYDFLPLNVDEEKKYEAKLGFGDGSFPLVVVTKRMADETVKVPAGEYQNCQHYVKKITVTFSRDGNEMAIKTTQDVWYHPSVNGLVKDVFKREAMVFNGETRDGYTATSELKSYTNGKS